jgi:hypothetical protein
VKAKTEIWEMSEEIALASIASVFQTALASKASTSSVVEAHQVYC